MPRGESILIVDDDENTRELVTAMLSPEGYRLDTAEDAEQALECLRSNDYDLVLTDVRMPGMDGLTLLRRIKEARPHTKVVVMTADITPHTVISAIRDQAYTYLGKPLSRAHLVETLESALSTPIGPDDIQIISAKPDWISLKVRCRLITADRLAQFFRELATELQPGERDSVSTAFRELLLNAIEHGGKNDPEQIVHLSYVRTKRSIIYYIRDPGEGFSIDNLPHAAVSNTPGAPFGHAEVREKLGIRPGGFGILLTKNFADDLVYSEKGNEVILIKYVA